MIQIQHAPREIFEDDGYKPPEGLTDTEAAYQAGLEGRKYLSISTPMTDLAYERGVIARTGMPIIDDPASPSTRCLVGCNSCSA